MQVPHYFMPRPALNLDAATVAAFERLYAEAVAAGGEISYTLSAPKWQFLCYLTDYKALLLHGSGDPRIARFEPRQSNDIYEFGNRQAIYAASDGIWPLYFAILDRVTYPMGLVNSCARHRLPGDRRSDPYYFFSISRSALEHAPWRSGTIYLLPRAPFEQQSPFDVSETEVFIQQWASAVPVTPLARLAVTADDFPFLAQIRGHDNDIVQARAKADPEGFPWLDEPYAS